MPKCSNKKLKIGIFLTYKCKRVVVFMDNYIIHWNYKFSTSGFIYTFIMSSNVNFYLMVFRTEKKIKVYRKKTSFLEVEVKQVEHLIALLICLNLFEFTNIISEHWNNNSPWGLGASDSVTDSSVLSNPVDAQNVSCLGLCGRDICLKRSA